MYIGSAIRQMGVLSPPIWNQLKTSVDVFRLRLVAGGICDFAFVFFRASLTEIQIIWGACSTMKLILA